MNATHKQIDYIRQLGRDVYGDEYWVNEHLGISRSMDLTKKITSAQASAIIALLLAAKESM